MLVVKIDVVDPEPLQAGIACLAPVFRSPTDTACLWIIGITEDAEFRGDNKLVTFTANRAPDKLLILERTVNVSGIEKGDAEFNGAMNGSDRFFLIAGSIEFGHAHTAEAKGGDSQAVTAKLTSFHSQLLRKRSA